METSMLEFNKLKQLRSNQSVGSNISKLKLNALFKCFADLLESLPTYEHNTTGEYKRLDLLHYSC